MGEKLENHLNASINSIVPHGSVRLLPSFATFRRVPVGNLYLAAYLH